jgi:hypothetical protein
MRSFPWERMAANARPFSKGMPMQKYATPLITRLI